MSTKIPQLNDYHMNDFEVRDRNAERKKKDKDFGDKKRGNPINVIAGDNVLVKQYRKNKSDTSFKPEAMTMKAKHGKSFILDSNGVEYKRNVTHLKRFRELSCRHNVVSSPVSISPVNLPSDVHVDPPIETVESPETQFLKLLY